MAIGGSRTLLDGSLAYWRPGRSALDDSPQRWCFLAHAALTALDIKKRTRNDYPDTLLTDSFST
jgi:hypothetical protein